MDHHGSRIGGVASYGFGWVELSWSRIGGMGQTKVRVPKKGSLGCLRPDSPGAPLSRASGLRLGNRVEPIAP